MLESKNICFDKIQEAFMNEKIDLSGVFSLAYIKKTRYTGSFHSMRYLLALKDGQISATIYEVSGGQKQRAAGPVLL